METDLTSILEPASNTTTETTAEASIVVENSSNVQTSTAPGENASASTTTITVQKEEEGQDGNERFTILTTDEDEIIEQIQEKTKLGKDKIRKALKFRKKEPIKDAIDEFEEEAIPTAPITQLGYITKVNGSVIIRLG